MGRVEEIISKYANSTESIEEFGRWLVSGRDAVEKEKALASLWSSLDSAPVGDDIARRKKKFRALVGALDRDGACRPQHRKSRFIWLVMAAVFAGIVSLTWFRRAPEYSPPIPRQVASLAVQAPVPEPAVPIQASLSSHAAGYSQKDIVTQGEGPADVPAALPSGNGGHATKTSDKRSGAGIEETQTLPGSCEVKDSEQESIIKKRQVSISLSGSGDLIASGAGGSSAGMVFGGGGFVSAANRDSAPVFYAPLSFGLSFRYPLFGRFSLESGFVYSYLHSSVSNLHYAGVPLCIDIELYSGQYFSSYASAGGSVMYCIQGGGREHPLQTAVSLAVGLDYKITTSLSLFGECSFNHYFRDGSPLETYFSNTPYAFGVKAGIRMSL